MRPKNKKLAVFGLAYSVGLKSLASALFKLVI